MVHVDGLTVKDFAAPNFSETDLQYSHLPASQRQAAVKRHSAAYVAEQEAIYARRMVSAGAKVVRPDASFQMLIAREAPPPLVQLIFDIRVSAALPATSTPLDTAPHTMPAEAAASNAAPLATGQPQVVPAQAVQQNAGPLAAEHPPPPAAPAEAAPHSAAPHSAAPPPAEPPAAAPSEVAAHSAAPHSAALPATEPPAAAPSEAAPHDTALLISAAPQTVAAGTAPAAPRSVQEVLDANAATLEALISGGTRTNDVQRESSACPTGTTAPPSSSTDAFQGALSAGATDQFITSSDVLLRFLAGLSDEQQWKVACMFLDSIGAARAKLNKHIERARELSSKLQGRFSSIAHLVPRPPWHNDYCEGGMAEFGHEVEKGGNRRPDAAHGKGMVRHNGTLQALQAKLQSSDPSEVALGQGFQKVADKLEKEARTPYGALRFEEETHRLNAMQEKAMLDAEKQARKEDQHEQDEANLASILPVRCRAEYELVLLTAKERDNLRKKAPLTCDCWGLYAMAQQPAARAKEAIRKLWRLDIVVQQPSLFKDVTAQFPKVTAESKMSNMKKEETCAALQLMVRTLERAMLVADGCSVQVRQAAEKQWEESGQAGRDAALTSYEELMEKVVAQSQQDAEMRYMEEHQGSA